MSQIKNMSRTPASLLEYVLRALAYLLLIRKERRRIKIALHRACIMQRSPAIIQADAPVQSDHLRTRLLPVGLSVCYDLRFPELYRRYAGASLIVVPAAFTAVTGEAHWEILLRARAIENQCYVLAAAQGGTHPNGRKTHGHSMLIDPWGVVVAQMGKGEGVVVGDIDPARLRDVRKNLPALEHRTL